MDRLHRQFAQHALLLEEAADLLAAASASLRAAILLMNAGAFEASSSHLETSLKVFADLEALMMRVEALTGQGDA